MRSFLNKIPMTVMLTIVASCAPIGSLKTRAAFDLNCTEDKLAVVDLDVSTKGVRGCGNQATYIWVCGRNQTCAWVMNTDVKGEKTN